MDNKPKQQDNSSVPSSAECFECKIYLAFMTCFGLTFADMKR